MQKDTDDNEERITQLIFLATLQGLSVGYSMIKLRTYTKYLQINYITNNCVELVVCMSWHKFKYGCLGMPKILRILITVYIQGLKLNFNTYIMDKLNVCTDGFVCFY